MAWLSRVSFVSSDTLSFTDINNLGNDIRAWGDNVNGGGYTLSNVVLSASAGTMATVIGGTGTTSTLTLRSTSGVGATGADIIFQTGNNGATEVMRLQNGGNVGIGTSTVSAKLHVTAGDAATANGQLIISGGRSLGTAMGSAGGILFSSSYWNSGFGAAGIYGGDNGGAGGNLMFATLSTGGGQSGSPSERMRIDSSGNVGIGTASPVLALHVVGTQGGPATSGTTPTGTARFVTVNSVMDIGSRSNGNTWMQVADRTNLAISYNLELNPNGGNVGIGTSPAYQLQLSTDSAAKPTTNTWTIASDARLKTVLGDYEKGLDAICALRPVRYKYNGFGGMVADGKEHISIVAQEAQEVFPECIGTFQGKLHGDDEQETELLNYNGHAITFALINAIKELKAKIDILEARN